MQNDFNLVYFIILPIVVLIFGFAIYFFIKSRKNLKETLEATRQNHNPLYKKEWAARNKKPEPASPVIRKEPVIKKEASPLDTAPAKIVADDRMVHNLKDTIAQQQQLLNSYLETIEELENRGKEELKKENIRLQEEIIRLHDVIAGKDEEIEELFQESRTAQKMAARIDEVYQEFEQLQTKMQILEKQAGKANALAIELEDTRNAYEVIHKELARKQEKLEEIMEDNRNMREAINQMEDKLSEANLQRQQLQKKVQFLSDLNNDMQSISETNKKLQTEIRRIGELESMLNMMAEEREFLMKKKDRS